MEQITLRPSGGFSARLRRQIWRLDPGLIQTSKAGLVLLALACTLLASYPLAELWPGMARLKLSLFMGGGAITLVLVMSPEPQARQRRLLLLGATALQAVLLSFGLIALLAGEAAVLLAKLAFLPLASACLFLTRYGAGATGLGKAIFSFALFAAMQHPQWPELPDLMLATALGSLVFLLLERALPRPSAYGMLLPAKRAYLTELGQRLRALSLSGSGQSALLGQAWLGRQPLRLLLRQARVEQPQHYALLSRRLLITYRLELALRLLVQSLETAGTLSDRLWGLAVLALNETAERVSAARPSGTAPGPALRRLRQAALALPPREATARRHLVGAAAAMERLLVLRTAIEEEQAPGRYDPQPPLPWTRGGLSPPARLALQGLVGVALATALDLGFTMAHGYWATITVFLLLSGSLGETLLRAQKRILGTAIGVLIALLYVWAFGQSGDLLLTVLSALSLALVVITMFRYWATAAVGFGFMAVSALHLIENLPLEHMLARIYETAIGAAIAMLVARLVLPLHISRSLEREIASWLEDAANLLSHLGKRPLDELRRQSIALGARASTIGDSLPQLRAEAWLGLRALQHPVAVHTALEAIIGYLALLEPSFRRLPLNQGEQPSDHEARQQLAYVALCLKALRAGEDAAVHRTLAQVEDHLRRDEGEDFVEPDLVHLDIRLEQIFYLTALIQVIDDLSLALHPHWQDDRSAALATEPTT